MTKKYALVILALFGVLILPVFVNAQTAGVLQRGATGGSVTALQDILKTDKSIYPEGLATGYFGPATENAIKRLQAKYGLPQTGVVDSQTAAIIFPSNVQLKILSPNGGESWDKSTSHSILWQVTVGPIMYKEKQLAPGYSSSPNSISVPPLQPFYDKISIDLIRDSAPSFRYHVGTASLYQTQYNWQIPDNISNASDYRIKISVGWDVPCYLGNSPICPTYFPQYFYSDVSDNTFSVTGASYPNDTIAKIKTALDQIQQQINSLQSQLNSLRNLVNSL